MFQQGIYNLQSIVHGVVGDRGDVFVLDGDESATPKSPNLGGPMLINTGAQVMVLDLDFALGIGLPETDTEEELFGVGGERLPTRQFTGFLHLPEWNITVPATFASFDLNRSQHEDEPHIMAIIGMDMLIDYVLTVDGPNGTIALSVPPSERG